MSCKRLLLLELVLGVVGLSACGATVPTAPTPVVQGVQGTLVIGLGGEALVGAQVEALDASGKVVAQTRTDAGGQYALGLAAGTYTILSPGQTLTSSVNQGGTGPVPFASSQVVGVGVQDKALTPVNLLQLPASARSNATTPPAVQLSGLSSTLDAGGRAEFDDVTTTAGGNSLSLLAASFGHEPVIFSLSRTSRKLLYIGGKFGEEAPSLIVKQHDTLDLKALAGGLSGDTTLYLLAVDSNNNRSVYPYPVKITGAPDGSDLTGAVQDLNVTAYTVANTRIQSQSAPSGANGALVYAALDWTPYKFPAVGAGALNQGYHIYRSLGGGAATLVATRGVSVTTDATGKTVVGNPTSWQDVSPLLAPGTKVSYTVRAFYGSHESPDSVASAATVLPVLSVKLTAPAEQASGVSTTPTFTWQTNGVGAYEYFVPVLSDTVNGGGTSGCGVLPVAQPGSDLLTLLQQATLSSARGFGFNTTLCGVVGGPSARGYSFGYQPGSTPAAVVLPLQEQRSYQWRLLEAVAVDDPASPHAVSVAFDGAGLLFTYNYYTGLYTFDGDQVFTFTTGGRQ